MDNILFARAGQRLDPYFYLHELRFLTGPGLARSSLECARTGARPAGSRERRADDWAVAAPKTRWQWQSHAANLQGRHEQRDAEKSFEGVPGGGNNCFKKTKEFSEVHLYLNLVRP